MAKVGKCWNRKAQKKANHLSSGEVQKTANCGSSGKVQKTANCGSSGKAQSSYWVFCTFPLHPFCAFPAKISSFACFSGKEVQEKQLICTLQPESDTVAVTGKCRKWENATANHGNSGKAQKTANHGSSGKVQISCWAFWALPLQIFYTFPFSGLLPNFPCFPSQN